MLKKIIFAALGLVLLSALGCGGFAFTQVRAFDESTSKVYEIAVPSTIARSTDAAVIARGKHIAESFGGCHGCHGENLGGGKKEDLGPLGKITYPNITTGKDGRGAEYSDGELWRLIRHGVKKDGKTAIFMPAQDMTWWPDDDVVAVISYIRSLPPVDGQPRIIEPSPLMKVLDRMDKIPADVARRIDHAKLATAPAPTPTKEYGAFLAAACKGCHGPNLSGGPIPGAPPSMPVPLNLTPHETGIGALTLDDFRSTLRTGVRKNGARLNPMMPIEMTKNYSDLETEALFAYLKAQPALAFGNR